MHPLVELVLARPRLLVEHAEAYAGLVGEETDRMSRRWRRQLLLACAALGCLTCAATLSGVSLLLAALLPGPAALSTGMLVGVPLAPLLIGLACVARLATAGSDPGPAELTVQWQADLQMLREATPP